ncbi:hypothetical protein TNCT_358921, partial [Trichonephila clavata]
LLSLIVTRDKFRKLCLLGRIG